MSSEATMFGGRPQTGGQAGTHSAPTYSVGADGAVTTGSSADMQSPPPAPQLPVPSPEGPPPVARWRTLVLSGRQLIPAPANVASSIIPPPLRSEPTPEEFFHLFATLERIAVTQAVLGVTSTVGGEGVTTVALHLALSIARSSYRRVCLVDLSMGEDELCRRVGAAPAPYGLIDCLEVDRPVSALDWPGPEALTLIPAGRKPMNPARTSRSPRTADLIAAVRSEYDAVVVDLPSVRSDNAVPMAQYLDGVVLVAQAGATPRVEIQKAINSLGRGLVTGVVLNRSASARRQSRPSRDS